MNATIKRATFEITDEEAIDLFHALKRDLEYTIDTHWNRHLATLRRERDELRAELLTTHQMACRVGLERDELRADKERLDWLLKESYEHKTCDALEDVYLSIRKGVGPADARIAIDCLIDSARAKQGEAP